MIALILGGAPAVFDEARAAAELLDRRHSVVAANLAGIHFDGHLDAWSTLHPDYLAGWAEERAGKPAGRLFTPDLTPERWPGSSGLYALQCALFEMGATAAILCGVPMDSEAGHFSVPGSWAGTADYRQAFVAALPEIGGRVRSMSGWTAELFGKPTSEWVGAVDNIRPLGVTAPANARSDQMHHVKNVSDGEKTFWTMDLDGDRRLARLEPGESGDFDINPDHAVFQDGLEVSATRKQAAPSAAKPKA